MQLIQVIPLSRAGTVQELSYFTSKKLTPGTLIDIPLRSKQITALVIHSEEVADAKARIRASAFRMRKISPQKSAACLPEALLHAAKNCADYFATTEGAILFALLPQAILKNISVIAKKKSAAKEPVRTKFADERLVFQGSREKRITQYKHIVRESFAHKQSVIVLAPTFKEAQYLHERLSRGIPQFTHFLHGNLTPKQTTTVWQSALTDTHPQLFVMTPGSLALPRHDIGALIIDREGAPAYRSVARPFIDFAFVGEALARAHGWRLLRADNPLSVSTIHALKKGEYAEFDVVPMRAASSAHSALIDMRQTHEKGRVQPFTIFSDELRAALSRLEEAEGRGALFVARRGLATTVHCSDCGETVQCLSCKASVVLHKGSSENVFVCHSCGAMRSAHERCRFCNSWRLQSIGIGAELVAQELEKHFPRLAQFQLDRDNAQSHASAQEIVNAFYRSKSSVLIGTEMMLPYITENVSLCAVISVDSLLCLPNWNMYERVFSILLRLRERCDEQFLVQSRSPEHSVLRHALSGDIATFYKEEVTDRKEFAYPPFATLIKCTVEGSAGLVAKDMERLEKLLAPFGFTSIPHVFAGGASPRMHGFLRVPKNEWPTRELLALLKSLPPNVSIQINPSSIL